MDFIEFAHSHGILIERHKLNASENIRRCGTRSKPKSDNGAYWFDGHRGWVFDWAEGGKPIWWNSPEAPKFAPAPPKIDSGDKHAKASERAEEMLKAARLDSHPYLVSKGLTKELGFTLEGRLLVPMRDFWDDRLSGLQVINETPEGFEKRFTAGMKAKGAVLKLGSHSNETWLVEGYATGLSLRAALRQISVPATVIVCFSAGNLTHIGQAMKGKTVYVFADNDESKAGQKAAIESGHPWTMAEYVGFDANDIYKHKGLFALCRRVVELRIAKLERYGHS
jgi:Toprim domain